MSELQTIKVYIFDYTRAMQDKISHLSANWEEEGRPEAVSLVKWDINFLRDLQICAVKDCVHRALSSAIPGVFCSREVEAFLDTHIQFAQPELRSALKMILREGLIDLENTIYELIGRPTYNVWTYFHNGDINHLYLKCEGDFRIMQWEQEHLDHCGHYVAEMQVDDMTTEEALLENTSRGWTDEQLQQWQLELEREAIQDRLNGGLEYE